MVSKGYLDKNLMQNSALSCFMLTAFVHNYEMLTAKTSSPDLLKLLLVLPIIWNKESCLAIKARSFSTPLQAVLAECPTIKNNFQERIEAFTPVSCQGINLACASGLLKRISKEDVIYVSAAFNKWPQGSKPIHAPKDMLLAIPRLASWFKDIKTAQLYSQMLGI